MKRIAALFLALCLCISAGSALAANLWGTTPTAEPEVVTATYATTQAFTAVLDSYGLNYGVIGIDEDNDEHVIMNNTTDSLSYDIHYFFTQDGTHTLIRIWNLIDYDAAKRSDMQELVGLLNYSYRYAKFYLDDSDNSLTVSLDLYYRTTDQLGSIVMEATTDLVEIIDDCTTYLLPYKK